MCRVHTQLGFSLLEVVIASAIFAMAAFSIVGYQITALQRTQHALWQSMALLQAQNLLESLRVMRTDDLRQAELYRWNQINQRSLNKSRAQYQCSALQCTVKVWWRQRGIEKKLQLVGALR